MNNLKALRKSRGLTLQNVADQLGLSNSAISMYETGSRDVPTILLPKFAELFGCSINDIFTTEPIDMSALTPLEPVKILKPKDEMEQQLLERFRSLTFDNKLKAISYITTLTK